MVKFDIKLFLVCHIVNNMTCKIYFIQCLETGEIYIGSTKQKYVCNRISSHKTKRNCSSSQILDRDNYVCDILEEVEESQRYTREQYYIDTTDNCINDRRAYGFNKKAYHKQYRLDNIDRKKELDKQYRLHNKDKIKEKRSQKQTCECGSVFQVYNKSNHFKTIKHQNYLKTIR